MQINKTKIQKVILSVVKNKNILSLNYDSIDTINIILKIEKQLNIKVKTSEYTNFINFKKIIKFLSKR
jgi:acyl carrier protein